MDSLRELVRFYRALGDETRLRLVQLLAQQATGSVLCVGRLAHELGVSSPAVSQHLRVLKDLGLVRGERRRQHIHYYLDEERLVAYQRAAQELLGMSFVLSVSDPVIAEEATSMCECKCNCGCDQPDKLEGDPSECSPEQILECHGEVAEHPCESEKK